MQLTSVAGPEYWMARRENENTTPPIMRARLISAVKLSKQKRGITRELVSNRNLAAVEGEVGAGLRLVLEMTGHVPSFGRESK